MWRWRMRRSSQFKSIFQTRSFGWFCIILAILSQIYTLFGVLLQALVMWWYLKIDNYQGCIFLTRLPNFFSVIAVVWLISEICQSISCSGRHQEGTTSAWCEVVKLRGHDGRKATNTNKKNLCSHWDNLPLSLPSSGRYRRETEYTHT